MKELKKENLFLKGKCEKTDVSLIELVEEVIQACILTHSWQMLFWPKIFLVKFIFIYFKVLSCEIVGLWSLI